MGGWKVVRQVDRELGRPVLSRIYHGFSRVSHEREIEVLLLLVTCREQSGDEFSEEEEE